MALPLGTTQTTFFVRRVSAGQASTLRLTVRDGCGDWPTFAGDDASAL